jgi:CBS-domain-containing membrane protein
MQRKDVNAVHGSTAVYAWQLINNNFKVFPLLNFNENLYTAVTFVDFLMTYSLKIIYKKKTYSQYTRVCYNLSLQQ